MNLLTGVSSCCHIWLNLPLVAIQGVKIVTLVLSISSSIDPTKEEWWRETWQCSDSQRRRQWHPTPVLLPGKSHGWRSLVGCSPWGRKESDMTERLHFHFSLSCIGERNGNPLQCSCLENPRDGWAAVYGVAQSQTWLKRLSSSSSRLFQSNLLASLFALN